jgi:hypothetical protein
MLLTFKMLFQLPREWESRKGWRKGRLYSLLRLQGQESAGTHDRQVIAKSKQSKYQEKD